MWPIVLYDRAKTGKILWAVSSKRPPTSKNRHLIPYNSGLRKFLRKTIWLKPWAPFSFSIMQKLGRSLCPFGEKAKNLKNGHLIPYIAGLRIFSAIWLKRCASLSPTIMQKLSRSLRAVLEKNYKAKNTFLDSWSPMIKHQDFFRGADWLKRCALSY